MVTKEQREAAWERAATIRDRDPAVWRRDEMGNPVRHDLYGTHGEFGWEVDHRNPVSKGGTDHGRNLRILHHASNARKSDKT